MQIFKKSDYVVYNGKPLNYNDNNRSRSEKDEVYINVRNKRKVHSLLTALDELNYAPYMPPQAETRIHGIIQRGKRRRDGQHIEEVKLTLTKIEQCRDHLVQFELYHSCLPFMLAIHACHSCLHTDKLHTDKLHTHK